MARGQNPLKCGLPPIYFDLGIWGRVNIHPPSLLHKRGSVVSVYQFHLMMLIAVFLKHWN